MRFGFKRPGRSLETSPLGSHALGGSLTGVHCLRARRWLPLRQPDFAAGAVGRPSAPQVGGERRTRFLDCGQRELDGRGRILLCDVSVSLGRPRSSARSRADVASYPSDVIAAARLRAGRPCEGLLLVGSRGLLQCRSLDWAAYGPHDVLSSAPRHSSRQRRARLLPWHQLRARSVIRLCMKRSLVIQRAGDSARTRDDGAPAERAHVRRRTGRQPGPMPLSREALSCAGSMGPPVRQVRAMLGSVRFEFA